MTVLGGADSRPKGRWVSRLETLFVKQAFSSADCDSKGRVGNSMGVRGGELEASKGNAAGLVPPQYPSRVQLLFPVKQALGNLVYVSREKVCSYLKLGDGGGQRSVNKAE